MKGKGRGPQGTAREGTQNYVKFILRNPAPNINVGVAFVTTVLFTEATLGTRGFEQAANVS